MGDLRDRYGMGVRPVNSFVQLPSLEGELWAVNSETETVFRPINAFVQVPSFGGVLWVNSEIDTVVRPINSMEDMQMDKALVKVSFK